MVAFNAVFVQYCLYGYFDPRNDVLDPELTERLKSPAGGPIRVLIYMLEEAAVQVCVRLRATARYLMHLRRRSTMRMLVQVSSSVLVCWFRRIVVLR